MPCLRRMSVVFAPGFLLLQNPDDLLSRKSYPLHRPYPFPRPDFNSNTGGVSWAQVKLNRCQLKNVFSIVLKGTKFRLSLGSSFLGVQFSNGSFPTFSWFDKSREMRS